MNMYMLETSLKHKYVNMQTIMHDVFIKHVSELVLTYLQAWCKHVGKLGIIKFSKPM